MKINVAEGGANQVRRLAVSGPQHGDILANYTNIENAYGIVFTQNFIYVTGRTNPGKLYSITRNSPSQAVTTPWTNEKVLGAQASLIPLANPFSP